MLVITKRRYKKLHIIGGAGMFDAVTNFFRTLFTTNVAKHIASTALSAGKDAAKEMGAKALGVGKSVAVEAGKRLIDQVAAKLLTPKNTEIITELKGLRPQPAVITQKSKDTLQKLVNEETTNINKLLAGSGTTKPIAIQDLVRRLNGGGIKVV